MNNTRYHSLKILIVIFWEDVSHAMSISIANAQLYASQRATRDALPVLYSETVAEDGTLRDPFDPAAFHVGRDCEATGSIVFWSVEDAQPALVRLSCDRRDDGGRSVFWMVVPEVRLP